MSENEARGISRRGFLKGTAAASLGTAAAAAGITPEGVPTAVAAEPAPMPPHGAELRGLNFAAQSSTNEARFGFMFKSQPPHRAPDDLLRQLGGAMNMKEQPVIGDTITDPKTGATVKASKDHNDIFNENPNPLLTSGFTFVGQFVDHDITFDNTPIDQVQSDPYATKNFRSPRYDLDAIYGRGPSLDPQFYDPNDRDKFLIVKSEPVSKIGSDTLKTTEYVYDVPRGPAESDPERPDLVPKRKATIADPRNDQTLILVQLHVAMQRFHNKLVDYMRVLKVPRASVFESARRMARWHYQWIVIHEFLPAIAGSMASAVYQETSRAPRIDLRFYKPTNTEQRPFIPVEFSVAAYRFGHSIARPRYTVRDYITNSGATVPVSSVPLMAAELTYSNVENVLNGSRPIPPRLKLQWSKFFNLGSTRTARPVRQFDASLSDVLFSMPPTALPDSVSGENLLAVRNLSRGQIVGLPSGEQVARLMGVAPLTKAELSSNRRIEIAWPIMNNTVVPEEVTVEENPNLKAVFDHENWPGETPLWFYILKEAEIRGRGETLGPVGGRIVAEVLVGLLQRDLNSYLYLDPKWKPTTPIAPAYGKFTMADLLKFTGVWS